MKEQSRKLTSFVIGDFLGEHDANIPYLARILQIGFQVVSLLVELEWGPAFDTYDEWIIALHFYGSGLEVL